MEFLISKIFYFPVKSISFDKVNSIKVKKLIGLENDRIFSFSRNVDFEEAKLIEQDQHKRSLQKFLTLKNSPFLNKYNFSFKKDELVLREKDLEIKKISISKKKELKELAELLIKLEPQIKPPVFLLHNIKNPFFDTMPENSISLINLNTVNEFSQKIGTKIEFERFRGNIYVKNMPSWYEMKLIGKNIKINNCNFKVTEAIPRCSATNLIPKTDNHTINLPQTLKKIYGHINLGIFLEPLNDGEIKVNDSIQVLS